MKIPKLFIKELARALVKRAQEEDVLDSVLKDLKNVSTALSSEHEIASVLQNRNFDQVKRQKLLSSALKNQVHKFVLNALLTLQEKYLLHLLPLLLAAVIKAAKELADYNEVNIITAVELSDPERKRLKKNLIKKLGKSLKLNETIEEGILGGMILEIGSKRYDLSVKGWLFGLRNAIINAT